MGMGLFCHIANNKTGGNGLKLCQGIFRLAIRKTFFLEELPSTGTGCPGKWLSHHLWRYSKDMMWSLRMCFCGGLVSVTFMVELNDLKMFSHLNDSMILNY